MCKNLAEYDDYDIPSGYTCDICRELDNGNIETDVTKVIDVDNKEKSLCKDCLNEMAGKIKFIRIEEEHKSKFTNVPLWFQITK